MRKITDFLKPYKSKLITVAFMHAVSAACALMMPYVMSEIVDGGIKQGDIGIIISSAVIMFILAVMSVLTSIISNRINSTVTTGFSSSLCKAVFKKINSLSYEQYSKIGSSGLLTRSTDDVFNVENAASQLVYTLVTVPIYLIVGGILSFAADPLLSLIFVLAIPPVLIFIVLLVKPLHNMWDKADKYVDVQNRIVRERLSGLRVIRAFNNEEKEHNRAKHATEEMAGYIIKANVRMGYIYPVAMLILNIAAVALIYVGKERVEAGIITEAGSVISVIQYVALISNSILTLSWTIAWLPHLKVSVSRIGEVMNLDTVEAGADGISEKSFSDSDGISVDICNLNFTYPDSKVPALRDVSISVGKGETVAIIGGTGSGKSTVVRLLLALYSPDTGSIYIDGTDYKTLSRSEIRSAYSTALQRGMIFEGTVYDNVTMGNSDVKREEVFQALSDCMMSDFVNSHEEGLDYVLVGLGQNVSGGQKQRINMARTVLRKAPVYIFDDSFSALDYLTEKKIQKRLFERLRTKTKIIITQRVSTALSADRIYVMDKGAVVAEGTHKTLLESSDIYREICVSQLGKECVRGEKTDEKN